MSDLQQGMHEHIAETDRRSRRTTRSASLRQPMVGAVVNDPD